MCRCRTVSCRSNDETRQVSQNDRSPTRNTSNQGAELENSGIKKLGKPKLRNAKLTRHTSTCKAARCQRMTEQKHIYDPRVLARSLSTKRAFTSQPTSRSETYNNYDPHALPNVSSSSSLQAATSNGNRVRRAVESEKLRTLMAPE